MKKTLFLLGVVLIMASCGASKIERQTQRTFKGDWVLTDVELPSALVDVSLFDDVDTKCFEPSVWHFVPNNNKGNYTIENSDCSPGKRDFHWSVKENSDTGGFDLTLKPEQDGKNAQKVKSGYRLELVELDENQMVWEQTVSYDNEPFTIQMRFSKN